MIRNTSYLADKEYDLIIVGGGIFGACAAWDAALRGLSVAILEKQDFAHSTSANSFRMIHGGIRYLQHADFHRIRMSVRERRAFIRIAPHTAYPLPVVIPIYGHGLKGKEILRAGFFLYDIFSYDRNKGISDKERHIPRGRFISREETLRMFPHLNSDGLSGAAIFYDGQIYNPPRLALSFILSAVNAGASAENYMEVADFLQVDGKVAGVKARDRLTGVELEIRSKTVLTTAGPWSEELLKHKPGFQIKPKGTFSRDVCFIVPRRLTGDYALAVQGTTRDADAIISRQGRHLFLAPWRDYTLIGVWHVVHDRGPDDFNVSNEEIGSYIEEINDAYPGLDLGLKDVSMWNAGLVLFGDNSEGHGKLRFGKKSRIVDHAMDGGIEGMVTLIGARYTTARGDASDALDIICKKLGRRIQKSATDTTPIYGGRIGSFSEFLNKVNGEYGNKLEGDTIKSLVHNYGSEISQVMQYANGDPSLIETIGNSNVIKAEIAHAVKEEKAYKLQDVVFRRTDLATGKHPGEKAIEICAELMAAETGWDEQQIKEEIEEVNVVLNRICVNTTEKLEPTKVNYK